MSKEDKGYQPLVIADPEQENAPESGFWTTPDMYYTDPSGVPIPSFSVQEAAKCFFGRTPVWLRWRMRSNNTVDPVTGEVIEGDHPHGYFVLDGEVIEPKRLCDYSDTSNSNARVFTLHDIERMAHALAQDGTIDGTTLSIMVNIVRNVARIYGFIR